MQHPPRALRTTAFVIGIVFSGAALAAPKDGSSTDEDKANCLNTAAIQYSLATAQCAAYPSYSGAYQSCMIMAVNAYTLASVACTSEAALTTSGRTIGRPGLSLGTPLSDGHGGKPAKLSPVRLKFGN